MITASDIDKCLPCPKSVKQFDLKSKSQNKNDFQCARIRFFFVLSISPYRHSCNAYLLLFKQNSLIRFIQFHFSVGSLITVNNGSESIQTASFSLNLTGERKHCHCFDLRFSYQKLILRMDLIQPLHWTILLAQSAWVSQWNFCGFPFEYETVGMTLIWVKNCYHCTNKTRLFFIVQHIFWKDCRFRLQLIVRPKYGKWNQKLCNESWSTDNYFKMLHIIFHYEFALIPRHFAAHRPINIIDLS